MDVKVFISTLNLQPPPYLPLKPPPLKPGSFFCIPGKLQAGRGLYNCASECVWAQRVDVNAAGRWMESVWDADVGNCSCQSVSGQMESNLERQLDAEDLPGRNLRHPSHTLLRERIVPQTIHLLWILGPIRSLWAGTGRRCEGKEKTKKAALKDTVEADGRAEDANARRKQCTRAESQRDERGRCGRGRLATLDSISTLKDLLKKQQFFG